MPELLRRDLRGRGTDPAGGGGGREAETHGEDPVLRRSDPRLGGRPRARARELAPRRAPDPIRRGRVRRVWVAEPTVRGGGALRPARRRGALDPLTPPRPPLLRLRRRNPEKGVIRPRRTAIVFYTVQRMRRRYGRWRGGAAGRE